MTSCLWFVTVNTWLFFSLVDATSFNRHEAKFIPEFTIKLLIAACKKSCYKTSTANPWHGYQNTRTNSLLNEEISSQKESKHIDQFSE
nr:hypothetical protein [Tanacetum cinerariifolium]